MYESFEQLKTSSFLRKKIWSCPDISAPTLYQGEIVSFETRMKALFPSVKVECLHQLKSSLLLPAGLSKEPGLT